MRKIGIIRALEVASLILFLAVLSFGQRTAGLKVEKGGKAKPVTAEDSQGKKLTLDQYKGKLVLLDFWATWCPPCIEEIPTVKQLYKKYHKQGFEIIGFALDQDGETVTDFVEEHKMPWRQVLDGARYEGKFSDNYGVRFIPTMILLGPDGKVLDTQARGARLKTLVPEHIKSVTNKRPVVISGHDSPGEKQESNE